MNNNERINHDRVVFVDYIRVVACFLVMLVHASENFYAADSSGLAGCVSMLVNEDNRFWVAFYDGTLGRISVPLFMIVSAFLLVPMKSGYTMTSFYKRRLLRVVPPMVVFMFAYTFLPLLWNGMTWEQSMTDLKHLPFNFPSMAGHLWFMYPLISVYLIIPVVSPWLERASARDERVFLALFFVSSFTPFVHKFITPEVWGECFWNGYGMFWYVSGYLGYPVLAHHVRVHLKWSHGVHWLVVLGDGHAGCPHRYSYARMGLGILHSKHHYSHFWRVLDVLVHRAEQHAARYCRTLALVVWHLSDSLVLLGSYCRLFSQLHSSPTAHSGSFGYSDDCGAGVYLFGCCHQGAFASAGKQIHGRVLMFSL